MQPAVVVEPGPVATVVITRTPACGGCGICQVRGGTHRVRAVDLVGARRGQQVLVDFPRRAFLAAAALSFGFPLAGLLAGMILGTAAAREAPGGALGGLLGLAGAYFLLHLLDRRWQRWPRPAIVAACREIGGAQ